MGREDEAPADFLVGLVEGATFLHQTVQSLERRQRGVALVQVDHVGLDAERPQQAHAADSQQRILRQAHLTVALV